MCLVHVYVYGQLLNQAARAPLCANHSAGSEVIRLKSRTAFSATSSSKMANLRPTIPDFYSGKSVFVTGGSGFVGKVLVEKLLRSCPSIDTVYVLMRAKKDRSPEDRLRAILDLPLFDVLRQDSPHALSKLKVVEGDVRELDLGLAAEDRQLLRERVNVIFHCAASVRFDDALTDAVVMNVRGTREVVRLALETKKLDVLVHVSTTYCHTDRSVIEEALYPAHADWQKTIEVAEKADRNVVDALTAKYIAPLPNTYTFTKSLAEHVVHDLCRGRVPAVVFRPSVVVSTAYEPVVGWIDNFNGPVGLLVAVGKGVVRTVYGNPDVATDYVPVDMTVKALIMSSWKQATSREPLAEIAFYNASNNNMRVLTAKQMMEIGEDIFWEVPFKTVLWYPNTSITRCYYYHMMKLFFYQLLPAVVIDAVFRLTGRKPMLLKIQRRVHVAMMALQYFAQNQWQFKNDNTLALEKALLPTDMDVFSYGADKLMPASYFRSATKAAKKYLLKESDGDDEVARRNAWKMWVAAQLFNFLWYATLFWLVLVKMDAVAYLIKKYEDAWLYLTTD